MKVTPEIIRPFPNNGPRKTGGRKHGRKWIQIDKLEKSETGNQRAKNGKIITKKMVKKSLLLLTALKRI